MKFIEKRRIKDVGIEFKALLQLTGRKVLSNHQIINTFYQKERILASNTIPGLQYYTIPQ